MTLPVVLHSGEGELVTIGTSQCTFKLTGKDTHGRFGLFEYICSQKPMVLVLISTKK